MPRSPVRLLVKLDRACAQSWDQLVGSEQRRYCASCEKHVHNLSSMTTHAAERLLASDPTACVRYLQRSDGSVRTLDPHVTRVSSALSVAAAAALLLHTASCTTEQATPATATEQPPHDASLPATKVVEDKKASFEERRLTAEELDEVLGGLPGMDVVDHRESLARRLFARSKGRLEACCAKAAQASTALVAALWRSNERTPTIFYRNASDRFRRCVEPIVERFRLPREQRGIRASVELCAGTVARAAKEPAVEASRCDGEQ